MQISFAITKKAVKYMQYITAAQAAQKWNVTVRRVQDLCRKHQIDGAVRWGRDWMIPADAHRPEDRRFKTITHTADTVAQLPRKNPAIAMSNLYNTPGTADRVAEEAFPNRPVAAQLFRAQIAFCRGELDKAIEIVGEIGERPRGQDLQIGCGVILGMCAVVKGDEELWRKARKEIISAPCHNNRDRYAMEFWLAAVESEIRETNTFPLWFARGMFDILPGDSFPGARFYYLRYLYLVGHESAMGQRGEADAQSSMKLFPQVAEPLISQSRKEGALISEAYMRLLCAVTYHDLGDDPMAIRHLDIAIKLIVPDKLYMILAEYRRQLDFLLDERLALVDPAAVTIVKNMNKQFLAGWTVLHNSQRGKTVSNELTPREREVAKHAAFGLSNKEIAQRLNISINTVKQSLRIAMDKTGAIRRSDLGSYL